MNQTLRSAEEIDLAATRKTARVAGFAYFVFALISVFTFIWLPSQVVVSGDAAATARNIATSDFLLRLSLAGTLVAMTLFVFVVLTLYRLFKNIDRGAAMHMVTFVVIGVTATVVDIFNSLAALVLLSGADFLAVFEKAQLESFAYAFLRLHTQASNVIGVFWGLWLFPFGLLVVKSGFIPRSFGVLLWIAGFGYVLNSIVTLLLPQYGPTAAQLTSPLLLGELPVIFWLMIVGARRRSAGSA